MEYFLNQVFDYDKEMNGLLVIELFCIKIASFCFKTGAELVHILEFPLKIGSENVH